MRGSWRTRAAHIFALGLILWWLGMFMAYSFLLQACWLGPSETTVTVPSLSYGVRCCLFISFCSWFVLKISLNLFMCDFSRTKRMSRRWILFRHWGRAPYQSWLFRILFNVHSENAYNLWSYCHNFCMVNKLIFNSLLDILLCNVPVNRWHEEAGWSEEFMALWVVACKDLNVVCSVNDSVLCSLSIHWSLWWVFIRWLNMVSIFICCLCLWFRLWLPMQESLHILAPGNIIFIFVPVLLIKLKLCKLCLIMAKFCFRVFLVIQLISVISFITWLNDCCRSEKNAERWYARSSCDHCYLKQITITSYSLCDLWVHRAIYGECWMNLESIFKVNGLHNWWEFHIYVTCSRIHASVISIASYVACFLGIIFMYIWYAPKPSCRLNILFITVTLALLQVITFVSAHPKVSTQFDINSHKHLQLWQRLTCRFIFATG